MPAAAGLAALGRTSRGGTVRIGYVIGGLGRGGAELQLMRLATAMSGRRHHVELLTYDGPSEFDESLRMEGVHVLSHECRGRFEKARRVRGWMRSRNLDVVHAVMKRASTLAVIARGLRRRPRVIATDMSAASYKGNTFVVRASLLAFAAADLVVTQTETNRQSIARLAPWLRGKVEIVRNGLDVDRFSPSEVAQGPGSGVFRFCAVGTVYRVKNPVRVVEACAELRRRGVGPFRFDWYGRIWENAVGPGAGSTGVRELVGRMGLEGIVNFHGETAEVENAYRNADALVHVSIQEGFPNAVAEGMSCGLPVIVSRVSDLPLVVQAARNGFVCDESSVAAIADAMERMMRLSREERASMGQSSRHLALEWFHMDRFLGQFESLYRRLAEA